MFIEQSDPGSICALFDQNEAKIVQDSVSHWLPGSNPEDKNSSKIALLSAELGYASDLRGGFRVIVSDPGPLALMGKIVRDYSGQIFPAEESIVDSTGAPNFTADRQRSASPFFSRLLRRLGPSHQTPNTQHTPPFSETTFDDVIGPHERAWALGTEIGVLASRLGFDSKCDEI